MDALGHVNNAKFFTYFEAARMEYLKEVGLWKRGQRDQGPLLVAESMNFRRQVVADQTIEIGVRISEARQRSYVMEVVMRDEQHNAVADGNCVLAWVDYAAQKAIAIPERIRELIKPPRPADTSA